MAWKRGGDKHNKRSHKLTLSGPHFVFVRASEYVGTPITWENIRKFHAQLFFEKGTPAREVSKANMSKAVQHMNSFLGDIRNPRVWSDVKLIREKKPKAKVPVDITPDGQQVQEPVLTARRRLRSYTKTGARVRLCACVSARVFICVCVF